MTPALHVAVYTLSWRKNAVKIAILIADDPPHGLETMDCVALLDEHGITLYIIALRGGPIDKVELTRQIHEVMHNEGVEVCRLKMNNQDGTTNIPSLTPTSEQISTLTILKEV